MDYKLGKEKEFNLSKKALNHIINGDISERQEKDVNDKTILKKVISGGLHTFRAWENFLSQRNDITHGLLVSPLNYDKWYYARKLQNDVILLKIPRDCFQSKAANITKFPETYYKSGYLWKTLFPTYFGEKDIINAINEALKNLNIEESKDDLLIGYYKINDIFKCIKIRIQIRGSEILSAFPTWEQPMTGNNGKPYSHIDSINTIFSSSCVFALNDYAKYLDNSLNKYNEKSLEVLKNKLPEILINRKPPKKDKDRKKQYIENLENLKKHGESLSEKEIINLYNLATSEEFSRNPQDFIRHIYNSNYKNIKNNLKLRNTAAIYQNLNEILLIINSWDLLNNNDYALKIIFHILKIKFIRTGGLDQWETKRLSNLMVTLVLTYKSSEKTLEFLKILSKSPIRIAFYLEFNLNQFLTKDPMFIGFTSHDIIPLNEDYLYNFISQILGINYTDNFDDEFNIRLARNMQTGEHINGLKIVKDSISHSLASDFNYFAMMFINLVELINIDDEAVKLMEEILYDYYRCTASNIQRTISKHKLILKENLEYGDKGFIRYTKAKHEYKFLSFINMMMIEEICKILRNNNRTKEAILFEGKFSSLYKEVIKIPMPASIPEYLKTDELN